MDDAQSSALARVMGLTDRARMLLLASLSGRRPELVIRTLDDYLASAPDEQGHVPPAPPERGHSALHRCEDLTDRERMLFLGFLCGRHPELVARALDDHEAKAGPVSKPRTIADWPDEKDP